MMLQSGYNQGSLLMTRAAFHHHSLLFGAVLLFTGSGTAFAQQNTPNEEVTIEGTDTIHNVHREIYGPPFREVFNIAVSHTVNYSDLDLTKDWGITLLEIRVREAARHVCHEIEHRYLEGYYKPMSDDTECIFNTTREGIAAAKKMEASAREPAKNVAALH
jgi:UrcA family protein